VSPRFAQTLMVLILAGSIAAASSSSTVASVQALLASVEADAAVMELAEGL